MIRHRVLVLFVAALSACATRDTCLTGHLEFPSPPPAFALVRSDYSSSAIVLLDARGLVVEHDFVDSGTHVSSLVSSLSGDVVLPTTPLGAGVVAWIERSSTDLVTLATRSTIAHVDARGGRSFDAYPQDALVLPDGRLLVSRLGVDGDSAAGSDLAVFADGTLDHEISLGLHDVAPDCRSDCALYPVPTVLLPMASGDARTVLVVMSHLSREFTHAGSGAVAAVDPSSLSVSQTVFLDPLSNCQYASRAPDDASHAFVSCTGLQTQDADGRRTSAGVAEISLSPAGELTVIGIAQAAVGAPVVGGGIIAIGGRRVLAVAREGDPQHTGLPDHLVEIDLATGESRDVMQTRGGFVLGDGVLAGDLALVPDASTSAIVRVDVAAPAHVLDRVSLDGCSRLPPLQIRPLASE